MKDVIFDDDEFKKSSLSNYKWIHACVQVARRQDAIGVRDSKDPSKVTLCFTPDEWKAFIQGVKQGEFDI
jgi:hypothetical protein